MYNNIVGVDDRDRALTREGQQETREIARWLAVQNQVPTHALVSPYLRARQTFELCHLLWEKNACVHIEYLQKEIPYISW